MHEERMADGERVVHRSEENREFWVERHWSWLVILFGLIFVTWLDSYMPTW